MRIQVGERARMRIIPKRVTITLTTLATLATLTTLTTLTTTTITPLILLLFFFLTLTHNRCLAIVPKLLTSCLPKRVDCLVSKIKSLFIDHTG